MNIFNIFKKKENVSKISTSSLVDIIAKTILLMEDCNKYKSEAEFLEAIDEVTNDSSLAWELYTLIPVAFTRLVINNVKYSDEVIMNFNNGKQVKKQLSKMNIYNIILKVVKEKIQEGNNDKIESILFLSAEFDAIHNAILNGSKMENLVISPLMMFAPDNYSPTQSF